MQENEPSSRNIGKFQSGDPLDYIFRGKLNALVSAAKKRVRGNLGHDSGTSAATANKLHSLRERINVENRTGSEIPAFSMFAPNKSAEINYFWGPPVRTEAISFEAGFNYFTNYDRAIADGEGEWCQLIGELPVRVRYNVNDGVPKIGHPIGPLETGDVSIKRAGYVVISEPDTSPEAGTPETVWIVKSNDHLIRALIVNDIDPGDAGEIEVQNAQICAGDPGVLDPNLATPAKPFVIREVLNLTGVVLKAGETHYAKPILGIGLCIIGEFDPIIKLEAQACFFPNATGNFTLLTLNITTGNFITTAITVVAKDDYGRFMLLPGEVVDAAVYLDECGIAKYKLIGSYGLTRQGHVQSGIACKTSGNVAIINHGTQVTCTGAISQCIVVACNGQTDEEGRRFLYTGEKVTIHFQESTWKIRAQPIVTDAWAKLAADMCPDDPTGTIDIQTLDLNTYCDGVISSVLPVTVDNSRAGASGKIDDWVKFDIDFPEAGGTPTLWVVTATHHCRNIVVPEGGCNGNQNPDSGNFIRFDKDTCKIEGFVLSKTSQMFCGDEDWEDEIDLISQVVAVDAKLDPLQGCDFELTTSFVSLCVFDTEPLPIEVPSGSINFTTTTMYDTVELVYDPGEDPSGGSDPCPSPSLKLTGRPREVITCDSCDEISASQDPSDECSDQTVITELPLNESTAYYRIEVTQDGDKKCINLVPISFITFGDCDEGTPDELICINPCPPEDEGNQVVSP